MYLILFTVFTYDVIAGVVEFEGKMANSDNRGHAPPTTLMAFVEGQGGLH